MNATSAGPANNNGQSHLLLVEDDEACLLAYSTALRRAGFNVTTATDFRVALDVLESDRSLDLMLVDIVMPESVNGIALSRMARMRRPDLKVVYVTGYSIPGAEHEALGPILFKPIDEVKLVSEVMRVLSPA